ncbi:MULTISPECIES: EamA family transporter RarD [unclassified Devosia]|uniref:EamA family transporter RarD n=1 Tax=unclassified Devosia TaxID=196773 RepID=UPI00155239F2|nr:MULTISPECIES: EamA family transporter RarD [unclassified Devosia]
MSAPTSPATSPSTTRPQSGDARTGVLAAIGTFLCWGFLPLLFRQLDAVGSVMIVAERTLWSLLLLGVILLVTRKFGEVRALFADRRKAIIMLVSAVLLGGNWLLYIWAVETGQVIEASFGYFINPLVNVAMGMVLLGERQNRLQTIAIAIATFAILLQAIGMGSFPFIALGLALSFGFYGYFRKTVMAGPVSGLFGETVLLAPAALAYVVFNIATYGWGAHADPGTMVLLMLTGPATAVPLLLFAYGVQRLRLTTIGMLQYISPSLQFMVAVFVFHEELNGVRLVSFGLIWLSLAVFSYDSFRNRRLPVEPVPAG